MSTASKPWPTIIQGGMGAGVSGWLLARAVSQAGQLGVVAGTALDEILARRLQLGDSAGHLRRALAQLPVPGLAQRILERYFIEGGKAPDAAFKTLPPLDAGAASEREGLTVAGSFVEVYLAREGHAGRVGINLLEKIQVPTLPALYGAMLAGVGCVLMGAGIPRAIPGALDLLAAGLPAELVLDVRAESGARRHLLRFDPRTFMAGGAMPLQRPDFLPIVASATVASVLVRKASGRIDGLVVEGPSAGGHNAPPRDSAPGGDARETVFGPRDQPDCQAIARLGLPFWLAGACAHPAALRAAQAQGAVGIQVGTAFAFCAESGLTPALRLRALAHIRAGQARVRSDARASPTGFPFKVFELQDTLSQVQHSERRRRVCDLGYLRQAYARPDGDLGWRCPGEPERDYLRKGGSSEDLSGRLCVCNGLLANIGLGQVRRDGSRELPLLTSGADTEVVAQLLRSKGAHYTARDVLEYLLSGSRSTDYPLVSP